VVVLSHKGLGMAYAVSVFFVVVPSRIEQCLVGVDCGVLPEYLVLAGLPFEGLLSVGEDQLHWAHACPLQTVLLLGKDASSGPARTVPLLEGTVPLLEGTVPLLEGTVPLLEGTVPFVERVGEGIVATGDAAFAVVDHTFILEVAAVGDMEGELLEVRGLGGFVEGVSKNAVPGLQFLMAFCRHHCYSYYYKP